MGRPERVIDPSAGPLEQFAYDLRALRRTADGSPTLRQLETRSGYSKAALSQACSGRALPTLDVTLAYAGACGADMTVWETRWRELAALLRSTHPKLIPPGVDPDPPAGTAAALQPGNADEPPSNTDGPAGAGAPAPGRRPAVAVSPLRRSDPRQLGDHVLLGVLGAGGSGRVYLAKSPAGLPLAVKAIRPEYADSEDFRGRFRHELAAARQVQTQHGVPIVAADADAEQPWMAAACITGPSLEQAVSEHGPLPEPAIRILAARLAEALADLHRAGVVHRDLKPGNVLLDADGPRLIDFGVAHIAAATRLTAAGTRLGTPAFIAPEQITDDPVGPAADIFALGALLFFAATGTPPFGDGSPQVLFTRVVHTEPDLNNLAHLDSDLRELIAACLNKNPEQRPDTTAIIAAAESQSPQQDWLPPRVAEAAAERRRQIGAALATAPAAIDPGPDSSSPDAVSPLARTRQLRHRSIAVPVLIAAVIIAALLLAVPHDKHPMAAGPDTLPPATSSDPDGGPTGAPDTGEPSHTVSSTAAAPVEPGSAPAAIPPPQTSNTAPANAPDPSTVTPAQPHSTAPSTKPSSAPASPATTAAPAPPPIPSGWKVQATSSKTIEGLWNDVDATATYVIEDEKGNRVTNVGPGVQYHAFGGLYSGYTLCLRIKSVENGLSSAWSATLCAET